MKAAGRVTGSKAGARLRCRSCAALSPSMPEPTCPPEEAGGWSVAAALAPFTCCARQPGTPSLELLHVRRRGRSSGDPADAGAAQQCTCCSSKTGCRREHSSNSCVFRRRSAASPRMPNLLAFFRLPRKVHTAARPRNARPKPGTTAEPDRARRPLRFTKPYGRSASRRRRRHLRRRRPLRRDAACHPEAEWPPRRRRCLNLRSRRLAAVPSRSVDTSASSGNS